jgi:hypothetical protein
MIGVWLQTCISARLVGAYGLRSRLAKWYSSSPKARAQPRRCLRRLAKLTMSSDKTANNGMQRTRSVTFCFHAEPPIDAGVLMHHVSRLMPMPVARIIVAILCTLLGFHLLLEAYAIAQMNILPYLGNGYPWGLKGWVLNNLGVLMWHPWDSAFVIAIALFGVALVLFGFYALASKR